VRRLATLDRGQGTPAPWGSLGLSARLHIEGGVCPALRRPGARRTARGNATSHGPQTVGAFARGRIGGRVIGAALLLDSLLSPATALPAQAQEPELSVGDPHQIFLSS